MKLTAKQRKTIVDTFRKNNDIGFGRAFARAGLHMVDAQIDAQLAEDPTLLVEINEARNRNIETVKTALFVVATDTEHAKWFNAAQLALKAYGGQEFREKTEVDVTGDIKFVIESAFPADEEEATTDDGDDQGPGAVQGEPETG